MPIKDLVAKRKFQTEWIANRRVSFFEHKYCVFCGSTDELELDHIVRTNKTSHRIWSWSEIKMNAELLKCRVLCHNCHVNRHKREREKQLVHGTSNGYLQKKCRCRECKDWNMNYSRKRRAKAADALIAALDKERA